MDRKSFLWAYILKKYKNYSLIVHFSNKIIFSDSALSYLLKKSYEYDLISTRILENKKRKYGKIMNYSYAVDQNFFLFKPSLVPSIVRINQYGLAKLIRGEKKGNGRLKVRFFAEICRELIANNGKFTEINKKYFESLPPTLI